MGSRPANRARSRTNPVAHRGEKLHGDKIWDTVIREDFAQLRQSGLGRPLMKEIEQRFAAKR